MHKNDFFEVIKKCLRFMFGYLIRPLLVLIFQYKYKSTDKNNPLPPIDDQILLIPANQLAKKIRNRELKSYDVVKAYIDRIKQIQPLLNCVVYDCFEKALEQAKEIDQLLKLNSSPGDLSEEKKPLLGIPFSCKESLYCEGMPNAAGVKARRDFRAPHDADVVRHMKEAGGILICLTNTSELCMWFETSNKLYGQTNNPYNLSRIVGGSTGGEGSLLGGAGSLIGIGSDVGGSIRMPAFFNGVYGHKCSSNTISINTGHPPAYGNKRNMLSFGPMCRYASDLPLLFKIHSGPQVYADFKEKFEKKVDFSKLKFYVIYDLDCFLVSKCSTSSKRALDLVVSHVESSFDVKVIPLNLPKMKFAFQIWSASMAHGRQGEPRQFSRLLTDNAYEISPFIEFFKFFFTNNSDHTLPAILYAIFERLPKNDKYYYVGRELKEELSGILGSDGILLFPGFPTIAPYHNQPMLTNPFDFVYDGIFNALGLPSTQIPTGLDNRTGLPQGVQLVANHMNDHLCIRLAEHIEKNFIGWVPPF